MAGKVFLRTKLAPNVFFLLLVDRILIKIQSAQITNLRKLNFTTGNMNKYFLLITQKNTFMSFCFIFVPINSKI